MRLETGRIARQSNGAVLVSLGETTVLATVNAAKEPREDIDFFPLQVEYREKHYAGGKIPGGFFKREARPAEHEILTSRLTDRPVRPLFPKSFKYETQVIVTAMSSDGENMADVLAGVGASAALMVSDIPFAGPIATVRVGRVDNNFIVNPTREQMASSDMEIIVSGNDSTIVMVEGEAKLITEEEFLDALKFAHDPIKELIALQNKLVSELDIIKREAPPEEDNSEIEKAVEKLVSEKIDNAIKISDKIERQNAISVIYEEAQDSLTESFPQNQVPELYVNVPYPGNSPEIITDKIIKPFEKELNKLKGIEKIEATSIQDFGIVKIEFDFAITPKDAKRAVEEALSDARSTKSFAQDLPVEPTIQEIDVNEFPIININLSGEYPVDLLKEKAEIIKDKVEAIAEINAVDIRGVQQKKVKVETFPPLYKRRPD